MGSFCGGGGNNNTTTTVTAGQLDPLTERIKTIALGRGMDILNQSYPGYDPAKRTAGFSADQTAAFGKIRGFNQPGQGRIVDQGGSLGKISDYMNPYLDQAIAPAIRDIHRSGQIQRNDIGAAATMSNAFGDSRHGIAEGEQMRGENQAVGDLSAEARNAAWNNAMALRTGDRTSQRSDAMSLLNIGGLQQQLDQTGKNAQYEEFLRGTEWPFRGLDAIMSILGGSPTAQSSTSTTSQPKNNNWLMQLLGSLGGSFF